MNNTVFGSRAAAQSREGLSGLLQNSRVATRNDFTGGKSSVLMAQTT